MHQHVLLIKVTQNVMQYLCTINNSLSPLRGNRSQVNIRQSLSDLTTQYTRQFLHDTLIMLQQILFDLRLFMNGHSFSNTLNNVQQKGQTKGVQSQMPCSDGFTLNFSQLHSQPLHNQLMTLSVVGPDQFMNFNPHLLLSEGIKLPHMHIILNNLQQQQ